MSHRVAGRLVRVARYRTVLQAIHERPIGVRITDVETGLYGQAAFLPPRDNHVVAEVRLRVALREAGPEVKTCAK